MTAPSAPMTDPTSVMSRRIAAWSVDLFLFVALVFGVVAATGGIDFQTKTFDSASEAIDYCDALDKKDGQRACSPYQDEAIIAEVKGSADGVWLANTVFYVLLQGLAGGSIGKLLFGLRVVTADGRRAGVSKSLIRTFLWIVDAVTCMVPAIGGYLMLTKDGHQRFGDRVAGTYVVRKESVGTPIVIPPPPAAAPYAFHLPAPGYAPPPGWIPPPADGGDAAPFAQAPYSPPAAPTADGPHWDDDRETYIQFDRAVDMWVQWDDRAKHWRPIET